MAESVERQARARALSNTYADLRSNLQWTQLEAFEELIRIRLDERVLRQFQERFDSRELPLETVIGLIEDVIHSDDLLRAAQRLVASRPRDPNCLRVLALAFGIAGQVPFAVASAQRAVKLAPHDVRIAEEFAHWQRFAGSLLRNTSWLTKAAVVFDELTEREPQNPDFPFQAGLLKNDLRLFKQAERSFREAIARWSVHPRAFRFMGDSLRELGRITEAQQTYLKAGELFTLCARDSNPLRAELLFEEARDAYAQAHLAGYSLLAFESQLDRTDAIEEEYLEALSIEQASDNPDF